MKSEGFGLADQVRHVYTPEAHPGKEIHEDELVPGLKGSTLQLLMKRIGKRTRNQSDKAWRRS